MTEEGKAIAMLLGEKKGLQLSAVYEVALREMAEREGITQEQIRRQVRTMARRKTPGRRRKQNET